MKRLNLNNASAVHVYICRRIRHTRDEKMSEMFGKEFFVIQRSVLYRSLWKAFREVITSEDQMRHFDYLVK